MVLAAVYHGPGDLRLEEVPRPSIGAGEILLKVASASICGTDLRILKGAHRKYPPGTVRIPGHEVVGTIAELGGEIRNFAVGQAAFIAPNVGCGHCRQCISGNNNLCADYDAIGITLDGAFAEYMRVPASFVAQGNVMPISEGLGALGGVLIEPFACVLRGQNAIGIRPGDLVLIMGGGPIGLMHAKLAQLRGAGRVVVSEVAAERVAQARRLGTWRTIDAAAEDLAEIVRQESGERGADVVIVAAPAHAAQESSLNLAAIGGRINFFGGLPKDRSTISFDSNVVHYRELQVTATTGCSTANCAQAVEIVSSGQIDLAPLITDRFPLSEAASAFSAAAAPRSLKVALQP